MEPIRKIGVATAYYKESMDTLLRCVDSVKNQRFDEEHASVQVLHYMVADGFPQDALDNAGLKRHVRLDFAHRDMGDTPRGLGAMMAVADGCDAIAFLDADCSWEPSHCMTCMTEAAKHEALDFVVAKRTFVNLGGEAVAIEEEPEDSHVDTNCFFLLKGAFHTLSQWLLHPRMLSRIDDRVFYGLLKHQKLEHASCAVSTVNYLAKWNGEYLKAGEQPPAGAKSHADMTEIEAWWNALRPEEREKICRQMGFPVSTIWEEKGR